MFRSQPYPPIGFDGNIFCEVLEIVPEKKLAYSWKLGPKPGEITVDSLVTWTLINQGNGTELRLDHTGFTGVNDLPAYQAMFDGWKKNVDERMRKLIESTQHHETKH